MKSIILIITLALTASFALISCNDDEKAKESEEHYHGDGHDHTGENLEHHKGDGHNHE